MGIQAICKALDEKVSNICAQAECVVTSRDELTIKLREAITEVEEGYRLRAWAYISELMHSDDDQWSDIDRECWDEVHP